MVRRRWWKRRNVSFPCAVRSLEMNGFPIPHFLCLFRFSPWFRFSAAADTCYIPPPPESRFNIYFIMNRIPPFPLWNSVCKWWAANSCALLFNSFPCQQSPIYSQNVNECREMCVCMQGKQTHTQKPLRRVIGLMECRSAGMSGIEKMKFKMKRWRTRALVKQTN